jgi:hypothetical protein
MVMRKGKDSADIDNGLKYASLGQEWDDLHDTIPRMKYTRIITAEKQENGKWLFMCSCGFDFRYQGTCKHISMLLLHASDRQCAGCEMENIALRNTAAFAACRDETMIRRSAFDWKGIVCGHVTEESLNACPCPIDGQDGESEGNGFSDHDDGQASSQRKPSRKKRSPEEIELKLRREARMKQIQEHFYRVKAKLDSCKMADFWQKADDVDGHILDAWKGLGGVPDVAKTVVASRYKDDPKRGSGNSKRRKTTPANRPAAAGETPSSSYVAIPVSDTDDLNDLLNDGAPDESDEA